MNYKALLADLPFDINAEALVCALLENNVEQEISKQFLIRPLGHVNRSGGREVMNVTGSVFDTTGNELVYLDINRESLYDTLPEMLFIRQEENYEDDVEKAQHLASQEEKARKFFLPFEEVLYQTRIDLERNERSAIHDLITCLAKIYGLEKLADTEENREQVLSLALVLPFVEKVVGNWEATASFLTIMLRKRVEIVQKEPQQLTIPDNQLKSIGQGVLGEDFLLGDSFLDGIRILQVSVCDVLPQEVEHWLPEGSQRSLLEKHLFPFILPSGELAEISIEVADNDNYFSLDDSDQGNQNILGYTTKII